VNVVIDDDLATIVAELDLMNPLVASTKVGSKGSTNFKRTFRNFYGVSGFKCRIEGESMGKPRLNTDPILDTTPYGLGRARPFKNCRRSAASLQRPIPAALRPCGDSLSASHTLSRGQAETASAEHQKHDQNHGA
jgi:hypothetical protein